MPLDFSRLGGSSGGGSYSSSNPFASLAPSRTSPSVDDIPLSIPRTVTGPGGQADEEDDSSQTRGFPERINATNFLGSIVADPGATQDQTPYEIADFVGMAPARVLETPFSTLNVLTGGGSAPPPTQEGAGMMGPVGPDPKGLIDNIADEVGRVPILGDILSGANDLLTEASKIGPAIINSGDLDRLRKLRDQPDSARLVDVDRDFIGPGLLGNLTNLDMTVGEFRQEMVNRWGGDVAALDAAVQHVSDESAKGPIEGLLASTGYGERPASTNPLLNIGYSIAGDPTNLILGAGIVGKAGAILKPIRSGFGLASKMEKAGVASRVIPDAAVSAAGIAEGKAAAVTTQGVAHFIKNSLAHPERVYKPYVIGSTAYSAALAATEMATDWLDDNLPDDAPMAGFVKDLNAFADAVINDHPLSKGPVYAFAAAFNFPIRDFAKSGVQAAKKAGWTIKGGQGVASALGDALGAGKTASERIKWFKERYKGWAGIQTLVDHIDMVIVREKMNPILKTKFGVIDDVAQRERLLHDEVMSIVKRWRDDGRITNAERVQTFKGWYAEQGGFTKTGVDQVFDAERAGHQWNDVFIPTTLRLGRVLKERTDAVLQNKTQLTVDDVQAIRASWKLQRNPDGTVNLDAMRDTFQAFPQLIETDRKGKQRFAQFGTRDAKAPKWDTVRDWLKDLEEGLDTDADLTHELKMAEANQPRPTKIVQGPLTENGVQRMDGHRDASPEFARDVLGQANPLDGAAAPRTPPDPSLIRALEAQVKNATDLLAVARKRKDRDATNDLLRILDQAQRDLDELRGQTPEPPVSAAIYSGPRFYREMDPHAFENLITTPAKFAPEPMYVADVPELALGQGANAAGVRIQLRRDIGSSQRLPKPGQSPDLAELGTEYTVSFPSPDEFRSAVLRVEFPTETTTRSQASLDRLRWKLRDALGMEEVSPGVWEQTGRTPTPEPPVSTARVPSMDETAPMRVAADEAAGLDPVVMAEGDAAAIQAVSEATGLDFSGKGTSGDPAVDLRDFRKKLAEELDLPPGYTLEAPPHLATILRNSEIEAPQIQMQLLKMNALAEWLRYTGPLSPLARGMSWLLTPAATVEMRHNAEQAVMSYTLPLGAKPREIQRIIAELREDAAKPSFGFRSTEAHWFRSWDNLTGNQINKVAKKHLDPSVYAKIEKQYGSFSRMADRSFNRLIQKAHQNRNNRFNAADARKGKLGALREARREAEGRLSGLVETAWGAYQGTLPGHVGRAAKTLYPIFRFFMSPRWWAMNAFEANILGLAKYGSGIADKRAGMGTLIHRYGGTPDAKLVTEASEIVRASGPAPLSGRSMEGHISRNFDALRIESAQEVLDNLPRDGLEYQMLVRRFGPDEGTWSQQLDKMLYEFDVKGVEKSLQDEARRIFAQEDVTVLAPVIQRLYEINDKNYKALANMYEGNVSRTNLERIGNSYFLYWPLSYQLKAGKWLVDVMTERAFGRKTNFAGAYTYNHLLQTHKEMLGRDEEYRKMFEDNPDIWFAAQMIFPITPFDMGVSLNRGIRYAGGKLGFWGAYSASDDPIVAAQQIAKMGLLYDIDLLNQVWKDANDNQPKPEKPAAKPKPQPAALYPAPQRAPAVIPFGIGSP